jgi:hypothetical protein
MWSDYLQTLREQGVNVSAKPTHNFSYGPLPNYIGDLPTLTPACPRCYIHMSTYVRHLFGTSTPPSSIARETAAP